MQIFTRMLFFQNSYFLNLFILNFRTSCYQLATWPVVLANRLRMAQTCATGKAVQKLIIHMRAFPFHIVDQVISIGVPNLGSWPSLNLRTLTQDLYIWPSSLLPRRLMRVLGPSLYETGIWHLQLDLKRKSDRLAADLGIDENSPY